MQRGIERVRLVAYQDEDIVAAGVSRVRLHQRERGDDLVGRLAQAVEVRLYSERPDDVGLPTAQHARPLLLDADATAPLEDHAKARRAGPQLDG